jgi:NAD(P)-dependent dehydrogenase (short-subunit alcohol dehydrogenase family)
MVYLVTGCRSGFGLLISKTLGELGHTVYSGLRDLSTADALREATQGLAVHAVQLDVTSEADRRAVIDRIQTEQGRLDGLVNNAGIAIGGFLEEMAEDELRKTFEVNLFGLWNMTRDALPMMRKQRSGRIVNISSTSGVFALPGLGAYASSKFAVEGMTEAWRHELAPFGITACMVEPGPYATDILGRNRNVSRNAFAEGSDYTKMTTRLDALAQNVSKTAKDPKDVSDYIVWALTTTRRPPLRHLMGPGAKPRFFAKRLLPWGLIEMVVQRLAKLEA